MKKVVINSHSREQSSNAHLSSSNSPVPRRMHYRHAEWMCFQLIKLCFASVHRVPERILDNKTGNTLWTHLLVSTCCYISLLNFTSSPAKKQIWTIVWCLRDISPVPTCLCAGERWMQSSPAVGRYCSCCFSLGTHREGELGKPPLAPSTLDHLTAPLMTRELLPAGTKTV